MKKYRVLGERILVQRDPEEAQGHVLMPHNVKKKPKSGVVICVGPEVTYDLKEGDKVSFNEFAGYFLEESQDLEESDLIVMRQDEVLVVEVEETDSESSE
jgi:co-chaperonin GroES (HSP10)